LDVYLDGPNQLRILDNVTLLPHIGSATEEVRIAMGMAAPIKSLKHFFDSLSNL
ncbi:MAG: lactate dehydrogenase-like 2-hydroxyacid dehydrogenase, partial [Bermanella sp.]